MEACLRQQFTDAVFVEVGNIAGIWCGTDIYYQADREPAQQINEYWGRVVGMANGENAHGIFISQWMNEYIP